MKLDKIILLFLMFLLVPFSQAIDVNVERTGFSVYTTPLIQACSCALVRDNIEIYNQGDSTSFLIEIIEGNAFFEEKIVEISKNSKKSIPLFYRAECSNYKDQVKIRITSLKGGFKVLTKEYEVKTCQNLAVGAKKADYACYGTNNTYTFKIKNTGSFPENYVLSVKDLVINTSLNPSQSKVIELNLSAEDEILTFEFKAVNTGLKTSVEMPGFKPCYSHQIDIKEEYYLCKGIENNIFLNVKNNNNSKDTFQFSTNKGFLTLNEVTLDENETVETIIVLNPEKEGTESLRFTVKSYDGRTYYRTSLITENCFIPEIKPLDDVSICEDTLQYPVTIVNTGIKPSEFLLNIRNISKEVYLEAGEEKLIALELSFPEETGYYLERVFVHSKGHPELTVSKPFTIYKESKEDCFSVSLKKSEFEVNPYDNKIILRFLPEGLMSGKYELSLDSEILTVYEDEIIVPRYIDLFLELEDKPFGTYNSSIILSSSGNNYAFNISVIYKDFTLCRKIVNSLYQSIPYYIILILLILTGLLILISIVLGVSKTKLKVNNKKPWFLIPLFILLLLAIFVFTLESEEQKLLENKSELYFETFMNETFTLDLDQFFEDPDSDKLIYSFILEEDYSGFSDIFINDSIANIKPLSKDTIQMYFSAEDYANNTINSPVFTFQPVERKVKSFDETIKDYAWHFVLAFGFLFIIILCIFFIIFLRNKKVSLGRKKTLQSNTKRKKSDKKPSKKTVKKSEAKSKVNNENN